MPIELSYGSARIRMGRKGIPQLLDKSIGALRYERQRIELIGQYGSGG